MIKKITVEQLKPGVFVHDFNCGWLHHPFLRNRVKIETEKEIKSIRKIQIRELYIDTEKGEDVEDAPTKNEVDLDIQSRIEKACGQGDESLSLVPLHLALPAARRLIRDAKNTTKCLMDDVKIGKQVDMHQVESLVDQMTDSVLKNKDALVNLFRIKKKDEYTYMHSLSVSALCISFARQLGFDDKKVKAIGIGGLLHDIGKVKIPGVILNKPGPLTDAEFTTMKQHVAHGICVLSETTHIEADALCVPAHHHERLDGTGYPAALKGDQISFFGQIGAIVDIYDALTSERCYKDAMSPTIAMRKVFEWSDTYLNRELVERFIAHLGIYPIGTLVRLRNGIIGFVVDQGQKGLLYPVVRAAYDTKSSSLIEPFNIDLSRDSITGGLNEIVNCEAPGNWQLRPEKYLSQYCPA